MQIVSCKECGKKIERKNTNKPNGYVCFSCKKKRNKVATAKSYSKIQISQSDKLHKSLVRTMVAFYKWEDSTAKLEPNSLWIDKTLKLLNLISKSCELRNDKMV